MIKVSIKLLDLISPSPSPFLDDQRVSSDLEHESEVLPSFLSIWPRLGNPLSRKNVLARE